MGNNCTHKSNFIFILGFDFQKIINKKSFLYLGFQFIGYKDDLTLGVFLGAGIIGLGFGTLYVFNFLSVELIKCSFNNYILYMFIFYSCGGRRRGFFKKLYVKESF